MPRIILVRSSGPPREASERERATEQALYTCRTDNTENQSGVKMAANGRSERRIQQIWDAEVSLSKESVQKEKTVTENVSPHGARVTTARCWQHGTSVLSTLPRYGRSEDRRVGKEC